MVSVIFPRVGVEGRKIEHVKSQTRLACGGAWLACVQKKGEKRTAYVIHLTVTILVLMCVFSPHSREFGLARLK